MARWDLLSKGKRAAFVRGMGHTGRQVNWYWSHFTRRWGVRREEKVGGSGRCEERVSGVRAKARSTRHLPRSLRAWPRGDALSRPPVLFCLLFVSIIDSTEYQPLRYPLDILTQSCVARLNSVHHTFRANHLSIHVVSLRQHTPGIAGPSQRPP